MTFSIVIQSFPQYEWNNYRSVDIDVHGGGEWGWMFGVGIGCMGWRYQTMRWTKIWYSHVEDICVYHSSYEVNSGYSIVWSWILNLFHERDRVFCVCVFFCFFFYKSSYFTSEINSILNAKIIEFSVYYMFLFCEHISFES